MPNSTIKYNNCNIHNWTKISVISTTVAFEEPTFIEHSDWYNGLKLKIK